jgi:membrane fusion protein (multidrug efflux system)
MQSDQGRFVWTVDKEGKAAPRPVETASWQGQDWIIRKGLASGDKVIVDNLIKLRPGVPLQPHPPLPSPGAPDAGKSAGDAK